MQKYKIFALTLVHFPKKTYLRAAMSLGRLGLHCSFHICSPSLSCRTFRACGEIGRRARLRIWWFMPCRFESYQAHHNPPPTASQKPSGIFFMFRRAPSTSPMRGSAQSRMTVENQTDHRTRKWQPSTPPLWGRWRGLFLSSFLIASADAIRKPADAIRKPADTIRIFLPR